MSGLTYKTAVIATHGRNVPAGEYVKECSAQMEFLRPYVNEGSRVLEFGSGIGGNLISIAPLIRSGLGIEINRGYIRIARRLINGLQINNLTFLDFDGQNLPYLSERPSVIFSIGVFERLVKPKAINLLEQLAALLGSNGSLAVYFLSERARDTTFTSRLGPEAYTFWSRGEIRGVLLGLATPLSILSVEEWPCADVFVCRKST